jgi:hypothetical protein
MSTQEGLADLSAQVKVASSALERGDARTNKRIDQIEASVNEIFRKAQRPGFSGDRDDTTERSDAAEMVRIKHHLSRDEGRTNRVHPKRGAD